MAAHPQASAAAQRPTDRWSAHRAQAALVRTVVYLGPIAASIVFVHYAGQAVPAPLSSLWLYLAWWFGLSIAATGVLIAIDRMTRRLLPLAALLQLSLVFPDEAPSRFKVAFKAGDVDRLEARVAAKDAAARAATPSEAAARLLELVAALNIHDPMTRGHCDRVRAYAVMIGEELKLSQQELDLLNWAALLHDVGKLDVPTEILSKDGRPTDEEWQTLRQHPLFGEELAKPMRAWLGTWMSAIGYHHEHWDGKGYPRGIAGEEIPLPGRIVAVADVFDVITSARSYKKASAATEGRAEIARCAGTQFDPDVVRAFLNVSLGRMRLVMGPLSWLAHAPLLGRLPFTPALGTAASVFSVAAATAVGGVAGPATPRAASPAAPPTHIVQQTQHPTTATSVSHGRVTLWKSHPTPSPPRTGFPPPTLDPVSTGVPPPPLQPAEPQPPSQGDPAPQPAPTAPPGHEPPSFTAGPDVTVDEDVGPVSLPWASNIAADPVGTRVRFTVTTASSTLFSAAPRITDDGRLEFTPANNANGVAGAVVTATDGQGAQAEHSLKIAVAPVNDPPSFVSGGDVTAVDDDGPVGLLWATGVSPGPPNESTQVVSFSAETDRPDLFAPGGQPVIDNGGLLTFTPALLTGTATVTVTARDDGGNARDGVDATTETFHISLRPRNHAPILAVTGAEALEDAGPQSAQVVTAVGPGAPNESGQVVTLSLTTNHPELFSTQPALTQSGALTFTPAADAFGVATATVTANDDGGTADGGIDRTSATFTITLDPVNDAPSFVAGGNVTVLANAGSQSVPWAGGITVGPPNEAGQAVSFATTVTDPSLFSPGGEPVLAADGTLSFTPALAASGATTVTVSAHDSGGTANGGVDATGTTSFTITVTAVNQAPSFTGAGNVTSTEDAGAQTLQWATAISAGPNESSQAVTFSTSNTNPGLFAAAPAISPSGVLTYTAAPDANGVATVTVTARDDGGTANGGVDTATGTFQISVTPVNDAPSFSGGGNPSVLEDSGAQSLQWVTAVSSGPSDETGQQVFYSIASTNPALFLVQPQISATGALTYTPAVNASGSSTVTLTAQDDGGTANGGSDTSSQTFTISVTAVNDPPSFLPGGNQAVLEDAGAQNVPWATAVTAGPADEASQNVTFSTTNDANALFAVQPSVDAAGALTYTPAANTNGIATVTVTAHDDGGTANGGVDSTVPASFTITITAVNDAPTIGAIASQSANEDDGPQVVSLTAFTAGPGDEAAQVITVGASVDHPEYFDVAGQPTVDSAGTLVYTPAVGAYGTATVTLTVTDDGGIANGGIDSATATFTITIVPLPPIAGDDAYSATLLNQLTVDAAHGVLANDADVNSSTLTVTTQTTTSGLLGGTLTLAADGSFTYQPSLLSGQDQFTYTITNDNGDTATGTITIDVSLAAPSGGTFFLETSGLSAEVWSLGATAPAAVSPVPDLDADGHPGLTIAGGDGKETITDVKKQQAWTYEIGASTLSLHGPLTLNLTAASHNFDTGKAETLWLYIYDCPGGSSTASITGCTRLGQNKVLVAKWNSSSTYETHSAVVPVDADLAPGRQLRVRVLIGGADLWIPLVGPFTSSVDYTS
jgi:HD-GYP domain-containing protein (c-di-GMP phosphodiesterase class II)